MERIAGYLENTAAQRLIKGETTPKYKKKRVDAERIFLPISLLVVILYLCILCVPIIAIAKHAGLTNIMGTLTDPNCIGAIRLSAKTSMISVMFTFLLGTPTVFYLFHRRNRRWTKVLDSIVQLPIVLPPAVAGIGLLLAFGRNGLVGSVLSRYHVEVVFTPAAVVIAQFFVSSALYIQVLKTAVETVPGELFEVSYVLGAGKIETVVKVILPMLSKPVLLGLVLSWIRALGEFGATIMFAGNMLNRTRTIPLQIYTLMQTDMAMASAMAAMLFVMTFVLLMVVKIWLKEQG